MKAKVLAPTPKALTKINERLKSGSITTINLASKTSLGGTLENKLKLGRGISASPRYIRKITPKSSKKQHEINLGDGRLLD